MRWLLLIFLICVPITASAAKKPAPKKQEKDKCGLAEEAFKGLRELYGEQPFAQFTDNAGHELLMFASPHTWSWTIMQDTGDGKWCLVANGTSLKPAQRQRFLKLNEKKT